MSSVAGAPRILFISPHMPRALALRAAGATVDYMRSVPEMVTDRLDGAVIDVADPADAAEALARLREADPGLPVVLLSSHPSLAAVEGVSVVLPPASGEEILSALPRRGPAAAKVPEPRGMREPFGVSDAPAEAAAARASTVTLAPTVTHEPAVAPSLEPVFAPPARPVAPVSLPPMTESEPLPIDPPMVERTSRRRQSAPEDVAALARGARPVSALAEDLATHLAARLDSDVAVLLRRGSHWRVIAGEGLRPLEWRDLEELPEAMALLTDSHPTLSVGDSDDLRGQLIGVPLARHLSVLLTRNEDLLVALGRERPYRKADVQTLLKAVRAERDDLTTARALLHLADALEAHRLT